MIFAPIFFGQIIICPYKIYILEIFSFILANAS